MAAAFFMHRPLLLLFSVCVFSSCSRPDKKRAGEVRGIELKKGVVQAFVWVPPGEFLMGSQPSDSLRNEDEGPVKVRISKGFWMAKTEMTRDQWRALAGEDPGEFSFIRDRALEGVSWNDCVKLITSLPAPEKGWRFDLPTEAQWEYACRATANGASDLNEMAWWAGNSKGEPHPVGKKLPNLLGLYDMQGNVAEWCKDAYTGRLTGGKDPLAESGGGNQKAFRVIRGGSWDSQDACRPLSRNYDSPDLRINRVGLRLVVVRDP